VPTKIIFTYDASPLDIHMVMLYTCGIGGKHPPRTKEVRMTTPDPKVPGKSAPSDPPVEEKVADATHEATEKAEEKVNSIREEFRAVRNDADVKKVASEASPFLTGALFTAAMVIDPVLGTTYGVYKAGRFVQGVRNRRQAAKAVTHTDES